MIQKQATAPTHPNVSGFENNESYRYLDTVLVAPAM